MTQSPTPMDVPMDVPMDAGHTVPEEARTTASDGYLTPESSEPAPGMPLVSPEERRRLQAEWDRVQLGFIDDPRAAAVGAAEIAAGAVQAVTRELAARLGELDAWQDHTSSGDTELMRKAMRGYRELVGSLTAALPGSPERTGDGGGAGARRHGLTATQSSSAGQRAAQSGDTIS